MVLQPGERMIQTPRNYKSTTARETAERWATPALWLAVAALLGWAFALLLGIFADREAAKLTPWTPPPLSRESGPSRPVVAATSAQASAPWQWVGIADNRVYARSGNKPMSFAEGDALPNGDVLRKIERDAIVVFSGGRESRLNLFKSLQAATATSANSATTASAASAQSGCRLSAQDRAIATFVEPAVAAALLNEKATFARIFVPIINPGGASLSSGATGVRATATGGTTALFGIQDGDSLLRADGKSLASGLDVINEVIARVQRGETVAVDGERAGGARRWVFAPVSCRG